MIQQIGFTLYLGFVLCTESPDEDGQSAATNRSSHRRPREQWLPDGDGSLSNSRHDPVTSRVGAGTLGVRDGMCPSLVRRSKQFF